MADGPPYQQPARPLSEDEVTLLDYWRVLWRRKWLIGSLFTVAVVAALLVSLWMPKIYEASATVLPPLDSGHPGKLGALAALGGDMVGMSLPGMQATPVDVFSAMLHSKRVARKLVEQFDLMTRYEVEFIDDAIKTLQGNTRVSVSKEQVVTVAVESRDPQLAADLANAYIEELDRLNQELALRKAQQKRAFLEERMAEVRTDLRAAEEALVSFQAKNKTVALEQQASAAITAAAEIQGRISANEVRLQVMQNYLGENHPDMIKLKLEQQQLKEQLHLMESGEDGQGMLPGDRMHPAFVTVPDLGLRFARLKRDVKVQETLYTMLQSEHEQAKIAEERDTPTVQVLDWATPPRQKSKPSIRLNMMMAGALAGMAGIFLAFFLDYLERVRRMEAERGKEAVE